MKVGANGDLEVSVNPAGDVVLAFTDSEALTSQSVSLALHPGVLGAALVSALGGASWAQKAVDFIVSELVALAPKS